MSLHCGSVKRTKHLLGVALLGAVLLTLSPLTRAEVDGEELLAMMQSGQAGREAAQFFIDDVWQRWNDKVFCMPAGDRQQMSFDAVQAYLESHLGQLYRPRRYLIVQGLRSAFPCQSG